MTEQRRIVLPDLHIPFHDKKLLEHWLVRLRSITWDGVDIIGDFIDCYTLSRFDTNPQRKNTLQQELDEGHQLLEYIRSLAPGANIRYSEGNHEDRLRKVLWGKTPALAHLRNITIPDLMGLKDLEIGWHSTQDPYKIRGLWYTHGDLLRKHAGMSARAKSEAMNGSCIIGHTHRQGWSPFTTHTGTHDAYEVGHMADPAQLDYVRTCFNWQLGWAEVLFTEGTHHVNFYRVVDRGRERMVVGPEGVIGRWRTRR
jgi:hypothetical protein